MKIVALSVIFFYGRLVSGAIHTYQYIYTTTSGIPNFPVYSVAGSVDGLQVNYFDTEIKKFISRQEWVSGVLDADWKRFEEIFSADVPINVNAIAILKERFNQTGGVHTWMNMLGCQWDDETQVTDGFERWGYDGEDFVAFDLKNLCFIATTPEGLITKHKWDNEVGWMQSRKHYFTQTCIEWLKKYVQYGSSTLGRKVDPEVSLVQKGPEVACHATGFYPDSVMITWKKNGVEMDDDVDVGETLPNEDGTFQKRAVLTVSPEERKNAQYSCEVTHKGSIFRPREPRTGGEVDTGMGTGTIIGIIAAVLVVCGVIAGIVVMVLKRKGEKEYDKASSQDTNSDISNSNPIVRNETEKLNPDPSV